jgi:DNA-binding response OmpR family regulator
MWRWGLGKIVGGHPMTRPLENLTILLVEDDPIIALDLRLTLETAGATVIGPAHDVASAEAVMNSNTFDVAVLDHLIVGGDSLPVADALCRRGLRFLFHTSHIGVLPLKFPTVPIISKPSRPGELVAAVLALVNASRTIE